MIFDHALFEQAKGGRGYLILAAAAGWGAGLFTILQAAVISRVITAVFLENQGLTELLPWMGGLLFVLVARSLAQMGSEMLAHQASTHIRLRLRRVLMEHILALGPGFTQGEQSGEQAAAVLQGVDELDAYFSQYLPQVALAGIIPLSVLIIAFPMDWLSALVLLLTAPLIPIFMVLIGQASAAVTRRQFTALGRMSAFLLDTIQGLTTLKLLNQSAAQTERIARVAENYRVATMRVLRVAFLSALVLELVGTLSTAVIAVQTGLRLLEGGIAFEQAFFILLLAPEFYLPLRLMGLRFHAAETGRSAAQRIFQVLAIPAPAAAHASHNLESGSIRVAFEGVSFSYPDRREAALQQVAFWLHPGKVTALVGASGSGKSTIASLLMGFIRPDSGTIKVNSANLSDIPLEDWRAKVAWMPQRAFLFEGTIADNLRLGSPDATTEQIERAARQAHLADFIHSLPEGYAARLGEGGLGLSGGQAQRVALARAFLADTPLLVVDEPTNWLDPELEDALSQSLFELSANRTVLWIAHRLESVKRADWVVVLDAGRVVEQGTPEGLLRQGGAFARLLAEGEDLL